MKKLAFVVVFAAVLTCLVGAQEKADKPQRTEPEKQALAKIQKLGGLALELAQNDTHLDVSFMQIDGKFTDEHLVPLKDLKDLVHLNLRGQPVTDASTVHLKGLTSLTRLHLEKTQITDKGLENLKGLTNLEYLNLYGTAVTDAGLSSLKDMKKLKNLYLWQTKVTPAGAADLKKTLTQCDINLGIDETKVEPKKDEPKKDEKKKDEPKKDEKKDQPKKDEPKKDEKKDQPKKDEPKKDEPKKDEKKDQPKKDEPKKDEPKKDDKKDQPKKDEPKKDEPKKDDKKDQPKKDEPKKEDAKPAPVKLGLSINDPRALQGYTLLSPFDSPKTYLIDMQGKLVHTWESDCSIALFPMLLDNGHLLRPGSIGNESRVFGPGPGVGGRIQEFTWEGELVWDFKFYNAKQLPHHDFTRLPNGNVLLIVHDRKTTEEAIAAGRRPEMVGESHLIPDSLVEIKPTGKTTGEVVWEWHLWDHLVQDFDKSKANYGDVAQHPELVNINFGEEDLKPTANAQNNPMPGGGPPAQTRFRANPDITHFNGVAYNPDLDQISVSVHAFSEFWIIDHSTTKAQAASHAGGRSGKGGDLLYRWGNPRAYRAGTKDDQKLFSQHNAHWIPKGLPGEGHILVFNNGGGRKDGTYSSVDELILPADSQGNYVLKPGTPYGPSEPAWSYSAPKKSDFYSSFISGAQRLPNGNTFICSGANGTAFEVTPSKDIVWKYINPVKGGNTGFGATAKPAQVMPPITRDFLAVSTEQGKGLDDIQKEVDGRLEKLLTPEQRKLFADQPKTGDGFPGRFGLLLTDRDENRLKFTPEQKKEMAALQKIVDEKVEKVLSDAQRKQIKSTTNFGGPPPTAPAGPPQPGKILSAQQQDTLKLTPDQKKQLEIIQKGVDAMLDGLLTEDQRKQLKTMQQGPTIFAGPGGPPGRGPAGGNPMFRAYRFAVNHPAFAGRDLKGDKTLEELQKPKEPEKKEADKKEPEKKAPDKKEPEKKEPDKKN
jgi:hypothetical protein